ncbi:hypothetical protein [Lamprobacter modestohalophilus]|nr:hypothetical protein [Lamprobacter modestohalophilus]
MPIYQRPGSETYWIDIKLSSPRECADLLTRPLNAKRKNSTTHLKAQL